jgi:hypothetical protein
LFFHGAGDGSLAHLLEVGATILVGCFLKERKEQPRLAGYVIKKKGKRVNEQTNKNGSMRRNNKFVYVALCDK